MRLACQRFTFAIVLLASASVSAATFGPYLGDVAEDGISVVWRTDVAATSRVEWAVGASPGVLDQVTEDTTEVVQHEIRLTGLLPGTQYTYRVISSTGGNPVYASAEFTFRTAAGRGGLFRFVFLAEVHLNAAVAQFNEEIAAFDPWFQLQPGDNVDDSDNLAQFQSFFTQGDWYGSVPLFNVLGNHNYLAGGFINTDGAMTLEFMPPHQKYYTFRYGDVQFFAIDSEGYLSTEVTNNMPGWLDQVLGEATDGIDDPKFKVAFFHIPPVSSCGELICIARVFLENAFVDQQIVPRLESFGVDLVLVGHDKITEHSLRNGVHYVQVISGDGPRSTNGNNASSLFKDSAGRSLVQVDVSACAMAFDLVRPDGTIMYSYQIDGNCVDADNDGYDATVDCDDNDPAINPGAFDVCGDGIDQDCTGDDEPCAPGNDAGGDPTDGGMNGSSDGGNNFDGNSGGCDCHVGDAGHSHTGSATLALLAVIGLLLSLSIWRRRDCRARR